MPGLHLGFEEAVITIITKRHKASLLAVKGH